MKYRKHIFAHLIAILIFSTSYVAAEEETPEGWNTIFVIFKKQEPSTGRPVPHLASMHYWQVSSSTALTNLNQEQCRDYFERRSEISLKLGGSDKYSVLFVWCDILHDAKVTGEADFLSMQGFRFYGPGRYRSLPPVTEEDCLRLLKNRQDVPRHRVFVCGNSANTWTSSWEPGE